jgi:hypothetical protein
MTNPLLLDDRQGHLACPHCGHPFQGRQKRTVAIPLEASRILKHLTPIQRHRAAAFLLGDSVSEIARQDGVGISAVSESLCAPSVARALQAAGTVCLGGTDALEYILGAVIAFASEVRERNRIVDDNDVLQLMTRALTLMFGETQPLRIP